jgi:flagellar L-ring protein precursor FlgH
MIVTRMALLFAMELLSGCAFRLDEIGREPRMSDVGSGLGSRLANGRLLRDNHGVPSARYAPPLDRNFVNLFRDTRARREGDLLTVNISINDRASLGNSADRSRDAEIKSSLDYVLGAFGLSSSGKTSFNTSSQSSAKGQGSIDRSEKIQLSIAAIVTGVLDSGALVIKGSHEIMVNFELRALTIEGVVRPGDISRDNTISYDKIAEARVSYGGRGRTMEILQPSVVHQMYDSIKPF